MDEMLPLPPVIRIEPASSCNLRCSHCPTGVVDMTRTVMKPDLFERVLSEVSKHVPPIRVAVLYHGGEPFLNKDFLSMARRVKALGIPFVKTVSNGMLIRPELMDEVVQCGLDAIEISLDGTSPQENDEIRVRSDFEKIKGVVFQLVEAKLRRKSAIQISLATTQFQTKARYRRDAKAPVPEYLQESFAPIADQLDFKSTWAMLWPSGAPSAGYDILADDRERVPPKSCDLIDDTLSIRANGEVVPCCYDLTSMGVMGDLRTSSLIDIWNGPVYRKFREDFSRGAFPRLCQDCVVVTGDRYLLRTPLPSLQKVFKISELT